VSPARSRLLALTLLVAGAAGGVACGGGAGGPGDDGGGADDPTEAFLGGTTTVFVTGVNAFGLPAANMTLPRSDTFFVGNSFFRTNWVTAPSSTTGRDGLGPLFNAVGCSACHLNDGRSAPPTGPGDVSVGLLFRLNAGQAPDGAPLGDPVYGGQLQPAAILGVAPEGRVDVDYVEEPGTYGDGTAYSLRRPVHTPADLAYGPLDPATVLSPRIGPSVFGLGLLASLDDAAILVREDPLDLDGNGVSGRANRVPDLVTGLLAVGRFGWKATQPTLLQQSAGAFQQDVGLTSALFPAETCTPTQGDCAGAPNGGTPEVEPVVMDPLVFYMHTLAVPGRRHVADVAVRRGRDLFQQIGCAACHTPTLVTGTNAAFPELSGQTIHAFTDLLLHDMGDGLADGSAEFLATGREWRTPPLWGLGLQQAVSGHTFLLHDGRARDAAEAILWHGGEAAAAREAFRLLPADARAALLAFLGDL
jgi:CxxC motif-containing protein (DUF1111 family)